MDAATQRLIKQVMDIRRTAAAAALARAEAELGRRGGELAALTIGMAREHAAAAELGQGPLAALALTAWHTAMTPRLAAAQNTLAAATADCNATRGATLAATRQEEALAAMLNGEARQAAKRAAARDPLLELMCLARDAGDGTRR